MFDRRAEGRSPWHRGEGFPIRGESWEKAWSGDVLGVRRNSKEAGVAGGAE